MIEQILEAWRINNRINLRLLSLMSDEGLSCTLSKRGGRTVRRQFAHLHNTRIWHLQRRAKHLADGALLFQTHEEPDRDVLEDALVDSASRVEQLLRRALEDARGVRVFKRGVVPYLAYLVAHEAHHRGNILLTLKQSGYGLDSKDRNQIWDWDRI